MNVVREIAGYQTSKDYKRLWEIAIKQSVLCVCDYHECRDSAQTIYDSAGVLFVSARGVSYICAKSVNEFIEQCQKINLEWVIPETHIKEISETISSKKCIAVYLSYHVSQLVDLEPVVKDVWKVGQELYSAMTQRINKDLEPK